MKNESNILRKLEEIDALLNTEELKGLEAKVIIKALKDAMKYNDDYNDSYSDALSYLFGVLKATKENKKYFK